MGNHPNDGNGYPSQALPTTSGWVEGGSLAYYLQHKRKEGIYLPGQKGDP
jgi:hypothetical protein